MSKKKTDEKEAAETVERFERALRAALDTPPEAPRKKATKRKRAKKVTKRRKKP